MNNYRGNKNLCKSGKEYLNDLLYKFGLFCLQHANTFDISHAFLRVTIAELSALKQVQFFWPTLYIRICQNILHSLQFHHNITHSTNPLYLHFVITSHIGISHRRRINITAELQTRYVFNSIHSAYITFWHHTKCTANDTQPLSEINSATR